MGKGGRNELLQSEFLFLLNFDISRGECRFLKIRYLFNLQQLISPINPPSCSSHFKIHTARHSCGLLLTHKCESSMFLKELVQPLHSDGITNGSHDSEDG